MREEGASSRPVQLGGEGGASYSDKATQDFAELEDGLTAGSLPYLCLPLWAECTLGGDWHPLLLSGRSLARSPGSEPVPGKGRGRG